MSDSQQQVAQTINRKLERLDRLTKRIGVVGGILGLVLTSISIWNLFIQNKLYSSQQLLSQRQAEAEGERRRVNFGVEVITTPAADNAVNVAIKLTNYSTRQVHFAMVGIRIWKTEWKPEDYILGEHPELLIYSDTKVVSCPEQICPRTTAKSRLQSTQHQIILGPGPGGAQKQSFGTYQISAKELRRGIWVQGFAYAEETDTETCVVAGPPVVDGAFPIFCEQSRKDQPRCDLKAKCLYDDVSESYSLVKK
jgi:hypothetical protein